MRYLGTVLVFLIAGFIVNCSAQLSNGQVNSQGQFPDLQQFLVSTTCVVPGKPYIIQVIRYLHDDYGNSKEPVENQWFGTTTDTRTGKKFGQWIFKLNGTWIAPDKGPAERLFFYTPSGGWKEVDYEEFSREIQQNFSDEDRAALPQTYCPR